MKYGYVVFDMDGTLIDTCEAIQHRLGYPLTDRRYSSTDLGITIQLMPYRQNALQRPRCAPPSARRAIVGLKMLGVRDEDIQRGILLWSENIKKYEDTPRAFPGVRELMDGLKAGGCRIGIATSKNAAELEHSREQFGDIVSRADCVICADDTAEHKPEPGPLLKYMERTGAKPSEVLYVGDTVYDMRCARGAGVDFALARWGNPDGRVDADYDEPTPLALLEKLR